MTFFKCLVSIIVVLIIAFSAFLFFMRFHDGPIEIFSGGPFSSGEMVTGAEPDWNDHKDRATLQLQSLQPARSRTLWLVVVDDRLFVPSAYMNTGFGKIWKQWPHHAVKDGRALIRLDDKIYPRQMIRLANDDELVPEIVEAIGNKYPGELTVEDVKTNNTWLFELAPTKPEL